VQLEVKLLFGNPAEAIEVMAALLGLPNVPRALQHDLQQQAQAASQVEVPPHETALVDSSGQPVTDRSADRPAVVPTKEAVEEAVEKLVAAKGMEAARQVFAAMGVRRVSMLQPSQFAEFIERCEAAKAL
jgi:hypothetical protein